MDFSSLKKFLFPTVVVVLAAAQTFGMDSARLRRESAQEEKSSPDTVIYRNTIYTKFRTEGWKAEDEGAFDLDTLSADTTKVLTARDTIFPPDSLKDIDPFRYRYYVALLDSLTHKQVRDSLIKSGDTLDYKRLDSIYYADSTIRAKEAFARWYASLDKAARKKYDYEQKMKRKQREMDSLFVIKDSLQAIKDSIAKFTPRIWETYAVADSLQYQRIIHWTRGPYFNEVKVQHPIDTSFNYYFNDSPTMRTDLGTVSLGISGAPSMSWDYFKRGQDMGGLGDGTGLDTDGISFYKPIQIYSYTPYTLPMWNSKTAYTELAYWGTLFANTENEDSNIHILSTQNIYPELNVTFGYDRWGANGMLLREDTDNRSFHIAGNYLGKRYSASAGYIYNKMKKSENGGIEDTFWIRDTTVGSREIAVRLSQANSMIRKHTVFLDQTLRIPFTFIEDLRHRGDTTYVRPDKDSLNTDITTAFIGHNLEISRLQRTYNDVIPTSDEKQRAMYNNAFYINPTTSADSLSVTTVENKVFIRLQPWKEEAVVSTLNVGLGNRIRSHYLFTPQSYLKTPRNTVWNSTYLYGGTNGKIGQGITWGADGYFTFLGQEIGDFGIQANAQMQFFPFRRARKSPVTLSAKFSTSLDEPEFYAQHYFSNHYKWDNDFGKISETRISGKIDIPHWKLKAEAGYSLLAGGIYYDTEGIVRQMTTPVSIAKIGLQKDFKFGILHLDNRGLVQLTSDPTVLPLPTVALNLKWFIEFDVVKDVMRMQIGANGLFTTKWYLPAYNPALGVFQTQDREMYGASPYVDAFVNIQWKNACIFLKYINANKGWPLDSIDYFSADRYIRSQSAFKFGIFWPFYLSPVPNPSISGRAGSVSGGSSSSSRSSGSGGSTRRSSGSSSARSR